MKIERVYAVILRYILVVPRDLYRVFELIFYPIMDIVLWGFMGLWVQQQTQRDFNFGILLPASLVLWMVVERTQSEISLNLAEEIWAHNIINLFVTPMKLIDWLTSVIILGIIKALFIFFFAALTLWVFLGVNEFEGVQYYSKEAFEELADWLFGLSVLSRAGTASPSSGKPALEAALRRRGEILELSRRSEYRLEVLLRKIAKG